MARYFYMLAAVCAAVAGAPPSPPRLYRPEAPAQQQSFTPVDYFMDNSEVSEYYNQVVQAPQKQSGRPERLETLEPDSEVELIPGAQQPQQPPQQNPVAPNVPGLLPGQRVYIVQMPVPGYRPGTIAGYQPVYIVAAAPQGQNPGPGYAVNGAAGIPGGVQGIQGIQNAQGVHSVQPVVPQGLIPQGFQGAVPGYQNAILLNPGRQVVSPVNPFFGYPGQQAGLLLGAPFGYRGFEQLYQQQINPGYGYQNVAVASPQQQQQQQSEGPRGGAVQLSQLVGLQQEQAHPNSYRNSGSPQQSEQQKRVGEASESVETKESLKEERRSIRPGQLQRKP